MKVKRISVDIHLNHWDILPFGIKQNWGSDNAMEYILSFLCFWFKVVIRWKKY